MSANISKNEKKQQTIDNKKIDESAGFRFDSGFQDSCELNDKHYESIKHDNTSSSDMKAGKSQDSGKNYTDSGIISCENITDSSHTSEAAINEILPYVPDYLKDTRRIPNPLWIYAEKFFEQDEETGCTKLFLAIIHNNEKAINILIAMAPNPFYLNIRNNAGQTALHLAVLLGQYLNVKKLINAGADMNVRDNRCNTPLHIACLNNDLNCVITIVSACHPQKTSFDDKKILANLELWNFDGETCFFVACKMQNLSIMRVLEANGANINAREGRSGYTPLHLAVETQKSDIIQFLCECSNICTDTESYEGLTAFQLSLLTHQETLAKFLVTRCGATPYLTSDGDSDLEDDSSEFDSDIESNQLVNKFNEVVAVI